MMTADFFFLGREEWGARGGVLQLQSRRLHLLCLTSGCVPASAVIFPAIDS